MKYFKVVVLFGLFFSIHNTLAQQRHTISGTILEEKSNETLIGVTIAIPELNTGTITNEYGFYSITLPNGKYTMVINYLGYEEISENTELKTDIEKNFSLIEQIETLDEIVITDDIERVRIRKPEMSLNKLSINTIKKIPVVLGEVDIVKAITLLPGVTNAGEGSSGFNVRGGSVDQNLILLDEATVYNSSHLFGLFSVFNPDAIKDLKLYKGGIPAKYGGRVSSVLDIYQKDGNNREFHANGGIGAVSSRLLAEGPIVKEKGSFLVGGRGSYAHLFLPLFNNDNTAYFYDLNTKLNYRLNPNNNLLLSGYFGRDVFSISESFVNTYGNTVLNLRWNHLFSNKLFSNLSLIYSDYFYGLDLDFVGFEWNSGIKNFNLKYDFKHYLSDKLKLNYGINNTYFKFNPGEIKPNSSDSGINRDKLIDKYANEFGVYLDFEHKFSEMIAIQFGLRLSQFTRLGQDELNTYTNNQAVLFNEDIQIYESAVPIGTESPSRSDILADFTNLEPRFSLAFAINDSNAIKISYNRMAQYLHLLSNTSSPTPLDVWTPSGPFAKPQLLDQLAIGFFKNFNNNTYSFEIESFYKTVKNRIDYIDGAELIANDAIEQVILNGEARAFGLELLLKKNEGRLKGWLAYTLSKSEQRTKGRTPEETGINNSEWYHTPYDKTHDISVNTSYELNNKWTLGANLIFQTGQPTNYPIGQYEFQGLVIPNYGLRNEARLPSYHRIDVSATLTPRKNKDRKFKGEWVFSVYNLYNRKNAASISFRENMDTGKNEALRLAIFGIIPSVTYNFKF